MSANLPVVVLVGRPNVGKSTLFNRLTGTRDALVADLPGLTRDRQYGSANHGSRRFIVVDTGGLSPTGRDALAEMAEEQARLALDEADAVVFLTDARDGLVAGDSTIARDLRKRGKPVHLVVNKAEGMGESVTAEFHRLGLGEPARISAERGEGIEALLDRVLAPFPEQAPEPAADQPLPGAPGGRVRIAVVGRPNVGKSTLVNRLVGEERVLAADTPGTTRDAIAVPFEYNGRPWTLVDTAGIRRKSSVSEHIEKLSIVKTLQAIEQADVVIAVVDAAGDIGVHDAKLLGLVAQYGRGLVLAANKWDGLDDSQRAKVRADIDFKLPFLDYVPLHFISAKHGSGLGELMKDVVAVYKATQRELKTPELTKVLEQAVFDHSPPAVIGRRIKLRYAHLGGRRPPVIVIHGNQTDKLPVSYHRYLLNAFRKAFDLRGLALRVEFKTGDNPFKGKKNELSGRQYKKRRRMIERRRR